MTFALIHPNAELLTEDAPMEGQTTCHPLRVGGGGLEKRGGTLNLEPDRGQPVFLVLLLKHTRLGVLRVCHFPQAP